MARAFAAIDIGSTATRLRMVRLCASGTILDEERERYPIALGADVYRAGVVQPETQARFLQAFAHISRRLSGFGVEARRVVATAALRDARNRDEVTGQVYDAHGIHIDVISRAEEMELSRHALVRALGFAESDSLLIDLGGGSLELMGVDEGRGISLGLGSLVLAERFPALKGACSKLIIRAASSYVVRELISHALRVKPSRCIGTGGNLQILAKLLPGAAGLWPRIDLEQVDPLIDTLADLDAESRAERFGMRCDRAEGLLPVAVILAELRRHYALTSIIVPGTGIREAILQQLSSRAPGLPLDDYLERNHVDCTPARRRARLALGLFRLLTPVHQLWPTACPTLELAAFGCELGKSVDETDVLRHGSYLIRHLRHVDLPLSTRSLAVAVFRYAYGARRPSREGDVERERATRILGAILEVASRAEPHAKPEELRADLTGTHLSVAMGVGYERRWPRLERALGRRLAIS